MLASLVFSRLSFSDTQSSVPSSSTLSSSPPPNPPPAIDQSLISLAYCLGPLYSLLPTRRFRLRRAPADSSFREEPARPYVYGSSGSRSQEASLGRWESQSLFNLGGRRQHSHHRLWILRVRNLGGLLIAISGGDHA